MGGSGTGFGSQTRGSQRPSEKAAISAAREKPTATQPQRRGRSDATTTTDHAAPSDPRDVAGPDRVSRQEPSNDTRTCNKLPDVYMYTREAVMDLDRGTLARIDRKLLAGLGQDEKFQMVRVPVTGAKWSTWKRYCDAAGISMGRAVLALIDRELGSVFGESTGDEVPLFIGEAEQRLAAAREARIASRERDLDAAEERLRGWTERLRLWEDDLKRLEQQVQLASKPAAQPRSASAKVGRNDRCPCGSGLKYKHCHSL